VKAVNPWMILVIAGCLFIVLAWVCAGKPPYDDDALLRPDLPPRVMVESEEETLKSG